MAIPSGTKFQGIPSSNNDLNKRSAQIAARAPLYDISDFGGDSTQTVQTLTLQGTTNASTSQAIYGINVIDTATTSNLATRLPDPTTGKQTTFVNNSTMSILVFPSVVGGKINGVVDGYASIPNDGKPHTFLCTANPLPGAWTWSAPAVNQIQLPRISVSHTQYNVTQAWGVGVPGAQSINPSGCGTWYNCFSVTSGAGQLVFTPGQDYWAGYTQLTPKRTITTTKVYSNVLAADTDGTNYPTINRFVSLVSANTGGSWANYTASSFSLGTSSGGLDVSSGPLNSPVLPGNQGTRYIIKEMNAIQVPPSETDLIGTDPDPSIGTSYLIYNINIPLTMATGTYDFDIFIEHT